MPYRVIIAGDRNWYCPDLAREVVARLVARHGPIEVIQGGAEGVDRAFAEATMEAGQGVRLYQAEWERWPYLTEWEYHGRAKDLRRDRTEIGEGVDLLVAVHRDLGNSHGTRECVDQAMSVGIPCVLIADEECTPVTLRERP